jgi:mRNA-degrading endonuclease RelE of RelBE toxin-antitoxin system
MSFNVKSLEAFERQAKRLAKKYPSLKSDLFALIQSLKENPEQGVALGKGCFKIQISIQSKGKRKSGGARIITNLVLIRETVYLLAIYDKSEKESLTNSELKELLTYIPEV